MDPTRSPTDSLLGEVAFVHRLARALLRDAELAHDVAQDALTAALHEGPSRHVRGWLAAVTRHLAGRAGRSARERAAKEALAARPPSGDGEARTAERLRLHRRLCDAVMSLPEPYRTAVTLRFFDELTPRAIARRLQLPAASVRQHVHRGLAMLRQQLDREPGGREQWRGAFGALALGKTTVPFLVWLPVLAMKKVVVSAAVVAAVGIGWWSWPRSDAPPMTSPVASHAHPQTASVAAASATGVEGERGAMRTAATVPAARDEAFVVRIVDEHEQPIAGADVHRWTAAGVATKQRTDRDGRAEFAGLDASGGLLVRASGWTPLVRELESLRGKITCSLPDGAVLDGQMLVDGVPAPAGLRLGVYVKLTLPKSAPREVREAIPDWRPSASAITSAAGAFVVRGLPADRKATIELPLTHWFLPEDASEERRHGFSGHSVLPARGVVLRTTQLPSVYGRIVWADDGSPVASPELMVYACFANGENSPSMGVTGNEDGTFAAGFYPSSNSKTLRWRRPEGRSPITSAWITVEAPGSNGSVRVDLDAMALAAMPINVRLPRAAITHFVVIDADDRPVTGARVSATPSTASDELGRGTFQGKRDKLLLVGADGYQVQPAVSDRPAAGTENDPLRFKLAPRNQLVLNVRDATGGVPAIRFVRILSRSGGLFRGKRFHSSFDDTFGGSEGNCHSNGRTQPDGSTEMYEWGCTTRPDANGRIELHSLEPGVACTATASDGFDSVIASASFVMPAAGETRTIDLVVNDTPRTVRGRVAARDGSPIPKALVELHAEHGSNEVRVGADGAFRFTGVYARGPLTLEAKLAGYAAAEQTLATVDEATEHVLVLEAGQHVTLRIVDEAGRPVETGARAEQAPGRSLHPQSLQPGEYLFTDLPSGLVTFEAAFGGERFRVQHDTSNPNVVLRVPRPGRVVVGPLKNGAEPHNLGVRATRLDAPGEPFHVRVGARDAEAELAVPGRYRVELIRYSWRGEGEARERVEEIAAPAQEIDVKAGELVRVKF